MLEALGLKLFPAIFYNILMGFVKDQLLILIFPPVGSSSLGMR